MNLLPMKGLRSAIGMRMIGQFLALALLPLGGLAVLVALPLGAALSLDQALAAVALLSGAGAVVLGAVQGGKMVRRLESMTETTSRIARQDFSGAVLDGGQDEVGKLAGAIHSMARDLDASLAAQQILAEMDDAILTKLDVGALIRNALRCLRLVTRGEVVVLGLFETATTDTLRVFVIRQGTRNQVTSHKFDIAPELKRRVPMVPTACSTEESPFPQEFEDGLRAEAGVGHFLAMPVARGNRAWGMMVSCHQQPTVLTDAQVKLLVGVANRLIAGFSSAERDQKLHSLAYVDPLTGLPNRVAMQSLLGQQLARAGRTKALMAILFIDLDRFKLANDTHGHAFGDRLLVQASNRIRNNVREDDVVARLGGDEFTVILPDVKTAREAASVARKLIQALSRRFEIEGQAIYTGASVGIAMFPDDGADGPELLKKADTAMYRAKSAGRSRFAFFEEPMNTESKRRAVLDEELRNALARGELILHYQPQVDLRTGALCGVEALVRWQHPAKGLLFPRDFIEFAEEIGLIPEIGAWVLAEACRQHRRWREEGVRVPRISVNVSNGQLPRSSFVPKVRTVLEATQMPPGSLEVEVTESMLVAGGKAAVDALHQLARDGVQIAIDDFGTGYSSFSYLKTMPAKVLKLDMSFLVDARADNDAGKIVAAIVNMAHALQKEVVAEGIERVDQLKLLKSLGCERGQGYLFGKPVEADQIARTFHRQDGSQAQATVPVSETSADCMTAAGAPPETGGAAPPAVDPPALAPAEAGAAAEAPAEEGCAAQAPAAEGAAAEAPGAEAPSGETLAEEGGSFALPATLPEDDPQAQAQALATLAPPLEGATLASLTGAEEDPAATVLIGSDEEAEPVPASASRLVPRPRPGSVQTTQEAIEQAAIELLDVPTEVAFAPQAAAAPAAAPAATLDDLAESHTQAPYPHFEAIARFASFPSTEIETRTGEEEAPSTTAGALLH
jgi:diguanylate cyclase (GGDEF)-like protein